MMRQLKFRAWGKYMSMGGSPEAENEMNYFELPDDYDKIGIAPIKYGIWMQCTGIKDKNGKEVYEGDIVKAKEYTAVVKSEMAFNCGCCATIYGWMVPEDLSPNSSYPEFAEVIGNIYENPELKPE